MSRFWRVFLCWFAALIFCWLGANLAGVVRFMGLKPFRYTGFPFTVAAWGSGIEEFFDWAHWQVMPSSRWEPRGCWHGFAPQPSPGSGGAVLPLDDWARRNVYLRPLTQPAARRARAGDFAPFDNQE